MAEGVIAIRATSTRMGNRLAIRADGSRPRMTQFESNGGRLMAPRRTSSGTTANGDRVVVTRTRPVTSGPG